jgi:hypothetical protein
MKNGSFQILLFEDNAADAFLVRMALDEVGLPFQLEVGSDGDVGAALLHGNGDAVLRGHGELLGGHRMVQYAVRAAGKRCGTALTQEGWFVGIFRVQASVTGKDRPAL